MDRERAVSFCNEGFGHRIADAGLSANPYGRFPWSNAFMPLLFHGAAQVGSTVKAVANPVSPETFVQYRSDRTDHESWFDD